MANGTLSNNEIGNGKKRRKNVPKTNGDTEEATVISMTYKKETPGTYVYASDDPDAFVNQLYVRKSGMPDGAKKTIVVSIR